jgi:hypothetical protein
MILLGQDDWYWVFYIIPGMQQTDHTLQRLPASDHIPRFVEQLIRILAWEIGRSELWYRKKGDGHTEALAMHRRTTRTSLVDVVRKFNPSPAKHGPF